MKISASIFHLKRKAKSLSREQDIPLHQALDQIATQEGCGSWSLLAARYSALDKSGRLFAQLKPGTLVLVGARPGQGKTLLCFELVVEAMRAGQPSRIFSLEFTEPQCLELFRGLGHEPGEYGRLFEFDGSDAICADHIVTKLASAPSGTLVVIDYLQLLDQRRDTPELSVQVQRLRAFAREKGMTMIFISQIDRHFDASKKPCPDLEDVRRPNPLDLRLFDKACFIHDGSMRYVKI